MWDLLQEYQETERGLRALLLKLEGQRPTTRGEEAILLEKRIRLTKDEIAEKVAIRVKIMAYLDCRERRE